MASTNSTDKPLNKYYYKKSTETLYGKGAYVNTGNQSDTEGKVVNGKYVSGKTYNKTYTLSGEVIEGEYEEAATLLSYAGGITSKSLTQATDEIDSDSNDDVASTYYIYGHPNKWVYDTKQIANNCGVASALNILSIAGKVDITDITDSVKAEYADNKDVSLVSSEDYLTLYAIQHDYCNHSKDISLYKSVSDIEEGDGGTYFVDIGSEQHIYHDTLQSVNSILRDYGVASQTVDYQVRTQGDDKVTEIVDTKEEEV